ncbi:MAG: hypothetical protein CEE40_00065 [Chloroflexi bacterium B3_Chlor]|nr:MAG: hypothetical protein CEE40_00065 [Chloroflexi bacterium B3_Chlor]
MATEGRLAQFPPFARLVEDDLSCQPCSRRIRPYIDKPPAIEYNHYESAYAGIAAVSDVRDCSTVR